MRGPPRVPAVAPDTFLGLTLCALLVAAPVAAQQPPTGPDTGLSPVADAVVGAFGSLLIGGGLILIAPEFTERTTDRVIDEPGETFLYGLGLFVAFVVLLFVLFVTIVGILLAIPLVIAAVVVAEIGFLAFGRTISDDWPVVLLVAVVLGGLANAVPIVGALVGFVLGCMGFGAWYLDYRDDGAGDVGSQSVDPVSGEPTGTTTTTGVETRDAGSAARGPADSSADQSVTDDPDGVSDDLDEWTAGIDDPSDRE